MSIDRPNATPFAVFARHHCVENPYPPNAVWERTTHAKWSQIDPRGTQDAWGGYADRVVAQAIIAAVNAEFGTNLRRMQGESRIRSEVRARIIASVLMHVMVGWGSARLGRLLNKDHTTILYYCRKMEGPWPAEIQAIVASVMGRVGVHLETQRYYQRTRPVEQVAV